MTPKDRLSGGTGGAGRLGEPRSPVRPGPPGPGAEESPADRLDRLMAAPVLQPLPPRWKRPHASAPPVSLRAGGRWPTESVWARARPPRALQWLSSRYLPLDPLTPETRPPGRTRLRPAEFGRPQRPPPRLRGR
ncbi:MAG TPA: hypothetical protein VMM12_00130 [Longimicrobiales bacterium]|nr:hypothetical protein [Longimicrobiales bacterium]